jgi:hypothetical protein
MEKLPAVEHKPITREEIETRASEMLRMQHAHNYPRPYGCRRTGVDIAARMEVPEVQSWYARRAFYELLGARIAEIIPDPARLSEIEIRRQELIAIQTKDGRRSRQVVDGPMMGDDLVFYAYDFMRDMHMVTDYDTRGMDSLTEGEHAVLRAQHCAQVMAMYEVL